MSCQCEGDKLFLQYMNQSTSRKTAKATDCMFLKIKTTFVFLFLQFLSLFVLAKGLEL